MSKKVQFVIPTYNADKNELASLFKSLKSFPIIVVDNTKKNLGYAGGVTVGIKRALHDGADWVVILNQDLHVDNKAIKKFATILLGSEIGIVGPFGGELDKKRWTTILPSIHVDYISGSCLAIHKNIFGKIEFYEPYFMYYEDADFCVRARKAGFPVEKIFIKGINHEENTSLGRGSFLHQYYLSRNHLLFVERNAPFFVKLHELFRLPKTIYEHWERRELGALLGIRDYLFRRFGIYTPLWS